MKGTGLIGVMTSLIRCELKEALGRVVRNVCFAVRRKLVKARKATIDEACALIRWNEIWREWHFMVKCAGLKAPDYNLYAEMRRCEDIVWGYWFDES